MAARSQRVLRYRDGADMRGDTAYSRSENSLKTNAEQWDEAKARGKEPAPLNTVAPAITGTATTGNTLTCSTGTWKGTSPSYTRQWYNAGVAIGGATNSTYVLQAGDVGDAITCIVTATTSAGGATTQVSNTVTPAS